MAANKKINDALHPLYTGDNKAPPIVGEIDLNGQIFDLDNSIQAQQLQSEVTKPTAITFKYKGEIAKGVVIPSRHPTATQYLRDIADYNDSSADIKKQIELSRKLYIWEGVVGTVIDMLCDFSITSIKVENITNKKGQEIIEFFLKEVNKGSNNITTGIVSLSHMISYCYFVDGNVFLYNKWAKTRYGKKASQQAKLPMLYIPINPVIITIPEDSLDFGNKEIRIDLSSYYRNSTTSDLKRMSNNKGIPLRFRRAISNREKSILLTDDEIYHIKRRGTTFGAWGLPYLTRSFSALASKRRLRALDDNTTDGMINMITIFKVGDPKVPATLHPDRITHLQTLLGSPTGSMTLAWSYDIDILQVGPKGDVLDFDNKYKQVNYDVITALGVPMSLLTGQGDRAGDVWVSLLMLMEKIEEERHEVREWLRLIVTRILEENGIYGEEPVIRTPSTKLRKEDIKNQILGLWDRGLLARETALEDSGYDYDAEKRKRLEEKKDGADDIFKRPLLPFDSPDGKPADRKNVDEKERTVDRKETKQVVDLKNEPTPKTEAIVEDLRWLRDKFAKLAKQRDVAYAALWYASKMKKISYIFGENGRGIHASSALLTLAATSNQPTTIMRAIANVESECIHAIKNVIGQLPRPKGRSL